jgi:hypothetical protein
MRKGFMLFTILVVILGNNIIFAQENDDVPYLSDDDIAAIELVLPEDIPDNVTEGSKEVVAEGEKTGEANEMSRLNTSQSIYHLLILDRTYCSLNSDIGDINSIEVLYKFKHGTNGYLIAIYISPKEGPVFPQLPDKSRILVDLITARKSTIKEYINSSSFRRFVTSRRILLQIQKILKTNNI